MRPRRRIFAIGGAGFGMRPENGALHDHVLSLSGMPEPRVCLLPTASGDPAEQVASFYSAFEQRPCEASHVALFRLGDRPVHLREHLLERDVIYIGGGSLLNLMALWRAHGIDRIMREAWNAGVLLCGFSAGSLCWFQVGITRSRGWPDPAIGLGLLEGSNCVHYDTDLGRRKAYRQHIGRGMVGGLALDDNVGALFEDRSLTQIVSARTNAAAYRVERVDGEVQETRLPLKELTPPPPLESSDEIAELRHLRELSQDRDGAPTSPGITRSHHA